MLGKELLVWSSFNGIISLIITLTNVRRMIIESIPQHFVQLFPLVLVFSLPMLGLRMLVSWRVSIDPGLIR